MKVLMIFFLFYLSSCGYPDIDSVPSFRELNLSEEELFDLCQLSSNDKKDIDTCIEDKLKN